MGSKIIINFYWVLVVALAIYFSHTYTVFLTFPSPDPF